MAKFSIVRIKGDGIGPEISDAVERILAAAGLDISWIDALAGESAVATAGNPLPDATLELIRAHRICLKGPLTTPKGTNAEHRSPNVALRKALKLAANIRPVVALPGVQCKDPKTRLVIFRENMEGLYSGAEYERREGCFVAEKVVTTEATERIAHAAFKYAQQHGLKKVTVFAKANIMQLTDGHFWEVCQRVHGDYPEVELNYMHADAGLMAMIMHPEQFQVLVMENFLGDLLSDGAAGLVGGLGVVPSANIGDEFAVFEAVHGTAPDIAGQGKANPTALLLSSLMLLEHVGETVASRRVHEALFETLRAGDVTGDLWTCGGPAGLPAADVIPQFRRGALATDEFVQALISRLR